MAKQTSSVVSFRITDAEKLAIMRKADGISVGEYARRAALELPSASRCIERAALGKVIRAIHLALDCVTTNAVELQVRTLLAEAIRVIDQNAAQLDGSSRDCA